MQNVFIKFIINSIFLKTADFTDYSELLLSCEGVAQQALLESSETDSTDSFPVKTLELLRKSPILTACISSDFGGLNLGLVPGSNFALLTLLKCIGGGNLVMGRVLEGHMNAQLLIAQFGTESQKSKFAEDAKEGKLFGVWNTQAQDGTFLTNSEAGQYLLNGSKTFATGTGFVFRPIITAEMPDGSWQMCVVPLDEIDAEIDSRWWNPMGMKSSRSYKISFSDAEIENGNLLGKSGNYYQQPAFSGGAIRFAAVQLGAAEALLDLTRKYLQELNRVDDPYQKMRLGEMAIAIESGNLWKKGAAEQLDNLMFESNAQKTEQFLAYADMMRTAIEQICTDVMVLCQKSVGARGLNKPYHFERIIRDLNTYLRQPAPDLSLANVGKYVLESTISSAALWTNKNI